MCLYGVLSRCSVWVLFHGVLLGCILAGSFMVFFEDVFKDSFGIYFCDVLSRFLISDFNLETLRNASS